MGMKTRILTTAFIIYALGLSINLNAQTNSDFKRFENNIQVGVGYFFDSKGAGSATGMAMKFFYGFDVFFNENFSVMPGVGYRQLADVKDHGIGSNPDWFTFLDVSMLMRYHFGTSGERFVLSLGPVYSYTLDADSYYIDADPSHGLNGKDKIKSFDVGICPGLAYEIGNHWRFGIEANLGLRNMKMEYPGLASGKQHINSFIGTVGFHF